MHLLGKTISKKFIISYLENEIKTSIKNDVGTALESYSLKWLNESEGVGFFAIPRMLFPEIDCLGSYLTGSTSTVVNIKSYLSMIMSKIDSRYAQYASFIAIVYRNGLIHQHIPKCFKYKNKRIGWAFQISSSNLPISALRKSHLIFDNNNLWINMTVFYSDLLNSIDIAIPIIANSYKKEFSKSYKEQHKSLTVSYFRRKYKNILSKKDFEFLEKI